MSLRSKTLMALVAAAALAAPSAYAADAAQGPAKAGRACFLSRDWAGWSAPGAGDFLLIRVRNREVWRVDLTPGSHVHKYGDEFLINKISGSDWICGPLDLDLQISDHHGFRQALIAKGLRPLSPAEIAAIPKKDLPG